MELVSVETFLERTMGGWPCQLNMNIYAGLPFVCACGNSHIFYPHTIQILRELRWMRLVFGCPDEDAITCVKIRGIFRYHFESLFGYCNAKSQPVQQQDFIPFLAGIVYPLQEGATQHIKAAARHFPNSTSQGRFMLLLLHVCLASILHTLSRASNLTSNFSSGFKDFAISQWDRPSGMSIEAVHKLFSYTQRELGDKLVNPRPEHLSEVGILLLSIALPEQSNFSVALADECGRCAQACWEQAGFETDKVLKAVGQ